jgi:hypothetical protein
MVQVVLLPLSSTTTLVAAMTDVCGATGRKRDTPALFCCSRTWLLGPHFTRCYLRGHPTGASPSVGSEKNKILIDTQTPRLLARVDTTKPGMRCESALVSIPRS